MSTNKSLLASAFGAEFHSMRVPGVQIQVKTNEGPVNAALGGKPFNPDAFFRVFDDSFDITFA
jgi:hypothetical protein